jgi:hypothetical protein
LPSSNQLRIENSFNYKDNEAIRQRVSTLTIVPVSDSNIYKTNSKKETSFSFKPPLNKVLQNLTDIQIGASLYHTPTSKDVAFSVQTANTDTCLTSEELENYTTITTDGTSFTITPKSGAPFLTNSSVSGTIYSA